ncbi:hypothetical protein IPM65_07360 [Candidatus Roizmanbacteria bacterium]|nr:MAG: hypothetical protein IPM65_07360 [Candidatus Roizmanbacteria bacterium]
MSQRDLLVIAVIIFLTIIAWVIVEVRAISQDTPTNEEIQSATVEYTINTDILDVLEKKTP